MSKRRRLKRSSLTHRVSAVLLAGLVPVLGMAGPASAAPATVITHEKDFVDSFVSVINGCDEAGPLYAVTLTGNQVEKETLKDDGTYHGTAARLRRSSPFRWTRASPATPGVGPWGAPSMATPPRSSPSSPTASLCSDRTARSTRRTR